MIKKKKSISLPLSPAGTLLIIDRDATIISSRQIAYACYRAAYDEIVVGADPKARLLNLEEFSRDYHPFQRTGIYEVYYPNLTEDEVEKVWETCWNYYITHFLEPEFSHLVPGMDECLRALKAAGAIIAILTASESDGRWMKHYRIPVDSYFSVNRLKAEGKIAGGKPEAIRYILDRYGKTPGEAATIGDNPKDHIEDLVSIGAPFGLDSPAARRDLEEAVDLFPLRVEDLYEIFGLRPPGGNDKGEPE